MDLTTVVDSTQGGESKKVTLVDGFTNDLQLQIDYEGNDHHIDLRKREVIALRDGLNTWLEEN